MFAKRLKELRLKKKLSQQNMADFLGITRQGYAKYERTDSTGSQPDLETLNKLANFFGVSIDYLVKGEDQANNSAKTELTEKDERDIAKRMEKLKKDLMEGANGEALTFRGEPMSPEAIESFLDAIEFAERQATRANKKYAPKKYRGKE